MYIVNFALNGHWSVVHAAAIESYPCKICLMIECMLYLLLAFHHTAFRSPLETMYWPLTLSHTHTNISRSTYIWQSNIESRTVREYYRGRGLGLNSGKP